MGGGGECLNHPLWIRDWSSGTQVSNTKGRLSFTWCLHKNIPRREPLFLPENRFFFFPPDTNSVKLGLFLFRTSVSLHCTNISPFRQNLTLTLLHRSPKAIAPPTAAGTRNACLQLVHALLTSSLQREDRGHVGKGWYSGDSQNCVKGKKTSRGESSNSKYFYTLIFFFSKKKKKLLIFFLKVLRKKKKVYKFSRREFKKEWNILFFLVQPWLFVYI